MKVWVWTISMPCEVEPGEAPVAECGVAATMQAAQKAAWDTFRGWFDERTGDEDCVWTDTEGAQHAWMEDGDHRFDVYGRELDA